MRPVTPTNIVEFEFSRTITKATKIFMDWGANGMEKAKTSIQLDFVFLFLYSWAISLGCKVAAFSSGISKISKTGLLLSRLVWIAGACDIVENISLLMVMQQMNSFLLELAFWTAGIKFTIVIGALFFIIVTAAIGLFRNLLQKNNDSIIT